MSHCQKTNKKKFMVHKYFMLHFLYELFFPLQILGWNLTKIYFCRLCVISFKLSNAFLFELCIFAPCIMHFKDCICDRSKNGTRTFFCCTGCENLHFFFFLNITLFNLTIKKSWPDLNQTLNISLQFTLGPLLLTFCF